MAYFSGKNIILIRSVFLWLFTYAFIVDPKLFTENSMVVLLSASMEMDHVRTDGNTLVGIVALLAGLLSISDLIVVTTPDYYILLQDILMTRLVVYFAVLAYAFFHYDPNFSNSVVFIFGFAEIFFHFTAINIVREERNEYRKVQLRKRFEDENAQLQEELSK